MSEIEDAPRTYSGALLAAIAVALLAAIGSLIWCFTLGSRLTTAQAELADAKQQNTQIAAELRETDARLKVATDELGKSVGLTQKELEQRAQAIIQREEAENQRLENAQKQTAQQVSAVSSQVSTVQSDVGGVKTDLTKTQSDLATAVSQLQSMKGDLSNTDSVIARNHDELVLLEHKGDRSYYEFSLDKGQKKPVGTVSLELKRTDQRPKRERALAVLQRQGTGPLRDCGQQHQLEESDYGLSFHAQELACSTYCSIMATWGASTRLGWYLKEKV
jgi:F0F1-type ATP synthase membrane subunit b/b'